MIYNYFTNSIYGTNIPKDIHNQIHKGKEKFHTNDSVIAYTIPRLLSYL